MPLPVLGDAVPVRGNRLSRGFGQALLGLLGWDLEGELPNRPKFVVIAAPHTSNWDFVIAMAAVLALGIDARWIGKHTLFRAPFGWLMRWLGGTPVDRRARQGIVAQTVQAFQDRERLVLGIAPEGTRKRVAQWKTGFYHIAHGAGVPIVPGYFDYVRKIAGFGPPLMPSGAMDEDVKTLQAFYATKPGKRPEQV